MSEVKTMTREEIVAQIGDTTRTATGVNLPDGWYKVAGLQERDASITVPGEPAADANSEATEETTNNVKWLDCHLHGVGGLKSGAISGGRLASAGFKEKPERGATSGKWFYPGVPINSCFDGSLADLLFNMQGKYVKIKGVKGRVPKFKLSSWDTEAKAKAGAAKGFSDKMFYRVEQISETEPAIKR